MEKNAWLESDKGIVIHLGMVDASGNNQWGLMLEPLANNEKFPLTHAFPITLSNKGPKTFALFFGHLF